MADFVRYRLEDGSEVTFEATEGSLVSRRSGQPQVADGGELKDRLLPIAHAAEEITRGLRQRLAPDEIQLDFGIKVSGKVTWWFIAKAGGEASMIVTLRWKGGDSSDSSPPAASPGADRAAGVDEP